MLMFDDFLSRLSSVYNGLDQGDPFSGILYLLYNSEILKNTSNQGWESALLFVDDAAIITRGINFTETHKKLQDIMHAQSRVTDRHVTNSSSLAQAGS